MIVKPKIRGFLCTTAHPEGCAKQVNKQIEFVNSKNKLKNSPQRVLVIGSSTGYGLASRIVAAFGSGASTIGVFYEKPPTDTRTASAGWYNSSAFEEAAKKAGIYAKSFNGDAFSAELKQQVIECIQNEFDGKVDLIIYSLAAPKRLDPNGVLYSSALKPVGEPYSDKTVDIMSGKVSNITIEPATPEEIEGTEKVMGGEDWELWIDELVKADLLSPGVQTVAYSYIGPEMTYPIYREGTIGLAKEDLEKTAEDLNARLQHHCQGRALVSVNKALVTQASAAIPVVPLYISLLYKVMKEANIHETCIEQIWRLFSDYLYVDDISVDEKQRIRIDDLEMREDIQQKVAELWAQVSTENIEQVSDIFGYREEFNQLFGFEVDGVDYNEEVNILRAVPSIEMETV